MTTSEFSYQFDVLYNNISSNQAPGLNEYEKSVFLTKAQRQLLYAYFSHSIDSVGGGFDGSQKRQYDFSEIVRTANLFNINTFTERIDDMEKTDRRSHVFLMPQDYFLSVNEVVFDDVMQYSVLPIDYLEYQRLMLKPYSYPVKKGVWRLITDKKNCNYWKDYVEGSQADYNFMSSWADQKRNLNVTIKYVKVSQGDPIIPSERDGIRYPFEYDNGKSFVFEYHGQCRIVADTGWSSDKLTYNVNIILYSTVEFDDEEVVNALKDGCRQFNATANIKGEGKFAKMCRHMDGFEMMSAPSKFENFASTEGYSFTTSVDQIPMVEIIGRFTGNPHYKMRYVKRPEPIILEDLTQYGSDVSIDNVTSVTECKLPEECHDEILERAVTLAKITWQGATSTQAATAQESKK